MKGISLQAGELCVFMAYIGKFGISFDGKTIEAMRMQSFRSIEQNSGQRDFAERCVSASFLTLTVQKF